MLLPICVYFIASTITFISYQEIPNALERVRDSETSAAITTSAIFTVFVRSCGVDHFVMAFAMVGMALGVFENHMLTWWFIAGSASIVALVSAMSAHVIRGMAK